MEKIPDKFPVERRSHRFDFELLNTEFDLRSKWIDKGMFAFVSWEWVNPFADWIGKRSCLEVMAGRGWLAYALRQRGVKIIATDNFSWHKSHKWDEPITKIEKLTGLNAVNKYGKSVDILIMSWPYMDSHAFKIISRLDDVNESALVVYIGESEGGCNANDKFFDHFDEIYDKEFNKAASKFKSWQFIHDKLKLGKFKKLTHEK